MFIEKAEESKEQLNIQRFKLALEELEMERKALYKVNEKILSATDAKQIKEEIKRRQMSHSELKLALMEVRYILCKPMAALQEGNIIIFCCYCLTHLLMDIIPMITLSLFTQKNKSTWP